MYSRYIEPRKYLTKEYNFVCELIFGSIPINREYIETSDIFKNNAPKILAKYPKLDVSFSGMSIQEHMYLGRN